MKRIKVKMNKHVYLGSSILEISKTLIMNFGMIILSQSISKMKNYATCMHTDSFITNIKTEHFYKDFADGIEKRFDTSNYEVNRPLPSRKNK